MSQSTLRAFFYCVQFPEDRKVGSVKIHKGKTVKSAPRKKEIMAIPKNVAKQGDRAEQIRKKVYEEGKTPEALGVKTQPAPGEAPPIETPIPPGDKIELGKETPPPEDYKKKYEDALHQVDVLKGKIDSEVPDLVSTNRMMAGQIATLQSTISDLQVKINKPVEEPAVIPDPQETQDLQSYKDSYPEIHRGQLIVMKQWVKSDEFKGMVSSIVDEVINSTMEPRVASMEKDVKKSVEETFTGKLDRLVKDENGNPCWRQINDDKEFTAWLKTEKYGGFTKFGLLRDTLSRGDADAVAEFFNDWQALKKTPGKPPKEEKPIDGEEKPAGDDEGLAPPKPGGAQSLKKPGDGDGKPKTFARSFVKKFHTDVALGRYKNKPKERDKLNFEIEEAMTKGLIVNG